MGQPVGRLSVVVLGTVTALALAGCGGSEPKAAPSTTAPVTPSTTPIPAGYPSNAPSGLPYAKPGTDLSLGEAATVAWQPPATGTTAAPTATPTATASTSSAPSATSTPDASSTPTGSASVTATPTKAVRPSGALRITVTAIQPTTYAKSFRDWKVSSALQTSSPYFVKATVTNVGTVDLGGLTLPLYGETSADTLVEPSTFASTFKPCNPGAFPKKFAAGATVKACLVYLVPDKGSLTGVTFRPSVDFVPITWSTPAALLPGAGTATGSATGSASASTSASTSGTIGVTPTPSATMTR
ncbi:hypothetical protein [Nocardioides sp.]|uniref:hypothetical protein n=1 Tax=Nocardioides sp. TaxID=35761 RepID=UPI002638541A|nr:hypothetical protein [Nocardioides sp.]